MLRDRFQIVVNNGHDKYTHIEDHINPSEPQLRGEGHIEHETAHRAACQRVQVLAPIWRQVNIQENYDAPNQSSSVHEVECYMSPQKNNIIISPGACAKFGLQRTNIFFNQSFDEVQEHASPAHYTEPKANMARQDGSVVTA